MLSTMRKSWLLFTLLTLVALSSAMSLEDALHIDGIEEYLHHGMRRQAQGTGSSQEATSDSEPTQTQQPSSDEPASTPTPTPTPTSTDEPSETPEPPEPSSNPPSSNGNSNPSSTAAPNSTPASTPAQSSPRTTGTIVRTTPLVATSVQQYTTVFTTVSNGQTQAVTQVGSSTALITTGQALATELASPSGEDSGSGLSDTNKKIIGGVVGGVGGAILLGGIAIVLWRLRSKKRVTEDDDDLMAGTGSALGDKTHGSPSSTPFQSNLEQYHNPGGRPNAAANF